MLDYMKNNVPEPTQAELVLRASDSLEELANLCELWAIEVMRDLHDTSN
ncbi:hypothetical protein KDA11_06940 [Candidatus Saccharibacteria bacterium]|nr:hypothetical protein [Candidatus Saccharibacteria bacterium]